MIFEQGIVEDRLCPLCHSCDKNDIGDTFHYLLMSEYFSDIRKKLLKMYYYNKPNIFKCKELLSNNKISSLKKISNLFCSNVIA